MDSELASLRAEVTDNLERCSSLAELEQARINCLGKKSKFTALMKGLGSLDQEARKQVGASLNNLKQYLESLFENKSRFLKEQHLKQELVAGRIDPTLLVNCPTPSFSSTRGIGSLHPVTRVRRELEDIFRGLGFTVVDGPEIESEYYNFQALNIPDTHPARDMQDTFWTTDGMLLRTHTSAMQVRALEHMKPPMRIVGPGRCFRHESIDASHEHTFYQMEGMMVDRHLSVGNLIYFMKTLLREIFQEEQRIRLRPGYFPFVEPGFELDIWFRGRWLELLPCGLVHPRVLEFGGIDPEKWQGFAFGLGLSRLVMTRYQIDDIRHMQAGDLRFLGQFR